MSEPNESLPAAIFPDMPRRILPTRWELSDPSHSPAMQFRYELLSRFKNPIHRVILRLSDAHGRELYQLADPRREVLDRVFGVGPDDWWLMEGDRPIATITRLPRHRGESAGPGPGLLTLPAATDDGIVTLVGDHALPAPGALALLLIARELTATWSC